MPEVFRVRYSGTSMSGGAGKGLSFSSPRLRELCMLRHGEGIGGSGAELRIEENFGAIKLACVAMCGQEPMCDPLFA